MKLPGIQEHTHKEREELIERITQKLKKRFGSNLKSIALSGSFPRNEDLDYSDIEFVVFLKKKPKDLKDIWYIENGIRIQIPFFEAMEFKKKYKGISKDWPWYGGDNLKAITNPKFIDDINRYQPADRQRKCLETAKNFFEEEVQEIYCKLFNSIVSGNGEFLPFILMDTVNYTFVVLSLINETPTPNYPKHIQTSKKFKAKPKEFDELVKIIINGEFSDTDRIMSLAAKTYKGVVSIFGDSKFKLFVRSL